MTAHVVALSGGKDSTALALWLAENEPREYTYVCTPTEEREGAIYGDIEGITQRHPLRELGWGVEDVWAYLSLRGVEIPQRTDCARCFFQKLGEWWDLWKEHPKAYAEAEEQERLTGHTFRSPGRDSWPAGLADLRREFERGNIPRDRQQLPLALEGRQSMCRACSL